jgi:hypothetical protein
VGQLAVGLDFARFIEQHRKDFFELLDKLIPEDAMTENMLLL